MQIGNYVRVENQSEVARLKQRLDEECAAANQALYGFAHVGKHERITHHMEKIGSLHEELSEKIGEKEATEVLVKVLERQ